MAPRRSLPPTGRWSSAIASALRTADYLLCRRCGVYVGAVCETGSGLRAVVNVNCLDDRAAFTQTPAAPDYDGEAAEERLARRANNWMPVTVAAPSSSVP